LLPTQPQIRIAIQQLTKRRDSGVTRDLRPQGLMLPANPGGIHWMCELLKASPNLRIWLLGPARVMM
jgi:hypothetical protein